MYRFSLTIVCALAFQLHGCTHQFLRNTAVSQASTVSDVLYQQVLNNVAKFHSRPASLPDFAVLTDGTNQVQDGATATTTMNWNPHRLTSQLLTLQGNRTLAENWKLAPVNTAARLDRLRCAFQIVTSSAPAGFVEQHTIGGGVDHVLSDRFCSSCGNSCLEKMIDVGLLPAPSTGSIDAGVLRVDDAAIRAKYLEEFNASFAERFPRCWYGIGCRRDVPRNACYSSECCGVYAWVCPEGMDALTRFTLTTVFLATTDPTKKESPAVSITRKFEKGDEHWEVTGPVKGTVLEFARQQAKADADLKEANNAALAYALSNAPKLGLGPGMTGAGKTGLGMQMLNQPNVQQQPLLFSSLLDELVKNVDPEKADPTALGDLQSKIKASQDARREVRRLEATVLPDSVPDRSAGVFDAPASLPLSRTYPGIEFVPSSPVIPGP